MGKSEIVAKFLEHGFLLSPTLLNQLLEGKTNPSLPTLKATALVVKELDDGSAIFSTKHTEEKKTLSVKDFTDYYNKKYNLIKDTLSTKLNPVSISKLGQSTKTAIVGLVYEKTPLGYLLEDPTGRVEAKLVETDKHGLQPPQPIPLNSILGFTGELKDKFFCVANIVYPDIPLDKKIKEADLLLSFRVENNKPKIIIDGEKEIELRPPVAASIKKGATINILAYKPEAQASKAQAIEALKLRYLPEPKIPKESYIIAEEPDIFWIIQKELWVENYKGVRIVSGEVVDMETKSMK